MDRLKDIDKVPYYWEKKICSPRFLNRSEQQQPMIYSISRLQLWFSLCSAYGRFFRGLVSNEPTRIWREYNLSTIPFAIARLHLEYSPDLHKAST